MTAKLFGMIGRIVLLCSLLLAQRVGMSPSLAATVAECGGRESAEAQAECLGSALGPGPLDSKDLRALEGIAGVLPQAVLAIVTEHLPSSSDPSPSDRLVAARLHDLHGRVLTELGRHDAAADAFGAALALDDGTLRLTWWSPEGEPRWTRSLDTGSGRIERAAESLLAAGRKTEADELISRALSLGTTGPAEEAWSPSGRPLPPGRDAAPTELQAEVWFKSVPDLMVPLASGGAEPLGERRSKALIVSFWASWCEPCERELPKLQVLFDSLHGNGLDVLAVNVGESPEIIASYMATHELTLPVALSTPALEEFFKTSTLPVVAVIDGRGQVRGRWAGYTPEFADQISTTVRAVIEEPSPPDVSVGKVLLGGDALRVAWMREASASVAALVIAPRTAALPGVLAAAGRTIVHYGVKGDTVRSQVSPISVSRLTRTTVDDEGHYELLGYRPGAAALVYFPADRSAPKNWNMDEPLFGAALRSGLPANQEEPAVMIATLGGVLGAAAIGAPTTPLAVAPAGASAVRPVAVHEASRWVVLGLDGHLVWSDGQGRPTMERSAPADGWMLVGGAPHQSGLGVAPSGLRASAMGRFLSTDREQIALATASGQLILLDASTGEVVYRALWPGISDLAAGDLVGDPRDDLAVAQGKSVVLLTAGLQNED